MILRNLPYLAPGSDTRRTSEAIQKRRANGDTCLRTNDDPEQQT